jgi:hypothetical protein
MADDTTSSARPSPAHAEKSGSGGSKGAQVDTARSSGEKTGGTTEAQQEEYAALGINPALDNRTGRQRPGARGFAAKPQQFPGPEVGHFAEHAEEYGGAFDAEFGLDDDEAVGMHSRGPHGRGDDRRVHDAGPDGEPADATGPHPVAHDK